MKIISQSIPDVILIEPVVHGDERGYFFETFRQDEFEEAIGYKVNFIQDNESRSSKGVLRGLHFQLPPFAQSKLVRVIEGEVLDVAVDIRQGSPSYGHHVTALLTGKNKRQLFIPRGFAHGFVVISDDAIFSYKVDNCYAPDCDRGLAFNDKELGIDWRISEEYLKLSEKDKNQPSLLQLEECFEYGVNYYA
mgnify:CR=1 FL=1